MNVPDWYAQGPRKMASFSRWMNLVALRYTSEIQWKASQHHLMRHAGDGVPGEIQTWGDVINIHRSYCFFSQSTTLRHSHVGATSTKFLLLSPFVSETKLCFLINCKREFKSQRSQSGPVFMLRLTVSVYFISVQVFSDNTSILSDSPQIALRPALISSEAPQIAEYCCTGASEVPQT